MQKYFFEFLGTLFITYVVFATGNYLAIGAAFALALLLTGAISGGAFNPAITLAFYASGKIEKGDLLPFIVSQLLGGMAGFTIYKNYVNKI